MSKKLINIKGKKFGHWTAIKFKRKTNSSHQIWLFECDCENKTRQELRLANVSRKYESSCEYCSKRKYHGLRQHSLYNVWSNIKQRCYNPKNKDYLDYGGRGITICDEWLCDFKRFYNWAITHNWQPNLEIDRIDNSDNQKYSPKNCRFVSKKINGGNKRNNVKITYNNRTQTISEWSRELNIKIHTLLSRLKSDWKIEKILNTPVRKMKDSK